MWTLFKFFNLLYLLISSYIWFAFMLPSNYIPIGAALLMIACFALGNFSIKFTDRAALILVMIVLYSLYSTFIIDLNFGVITFLSYIPVVLLFVLKKPLQEDLLKYVTKWFCILMGASLAFFLIHFVIPLPSSPFLPYQIANSYSPFDNYYLFMTTDMYLSENAGIFRFGGPFLEPGHQSMICGLILFANSFKMKERPLMWILVVSIIFSFSLAGYLILAVGWVFCKVRNIYTMVSIAGVFIGVWLFVTVIWNDGENAVNKLIVERLEYDNQKGIKGNKRTLKHTAYFFKECMKNGTAILGVRTQKYNNLKINGAGYKIFILRYGIVGTVLVGLLYLFMIPPGVNRKYATCFLILMALIFLQRAYPSWYSWLLPYVLGLGVNRPDMPGFAQFGSQEPEEVAEAPSISVDSELPRG